MEQIEANNILETIENKKWQWEGHMYGGEKTDRDKSDRLEYNWCKMTHREGVHEVVRWKKNFAGDSNEWNPLGEATFLHWTETG